MTHVTHDLRQLRVMILANRIRTYNTEKTNKEYKVLTPWTPTTEYCHGHLPLHWLRLKLLSQHMNLTELT